MKLLLAILAGICLATNFTNYHKTWGCFALARARCKIAAVILLDSLV